MTDEQNLDVAEVEAESFDALADQGRQRFQIAVDEDVAFRRDDEVGCQIFAADIVEIARDPKRREGLSPRGVGRGSKTQR
jgi:hypothetical protein